MSNTDIFLKVNSLIANEELIHEKIIISNVIHNYNLFIEMKKYNSYEIDILKLVKPGTTVKNAYEIYIEESNFNAMQTPFNLPRHSYDTICPSNIVLVLIELITRQRKDDRGVYYSFEGYALYLLVDILNESIWDARGEVTDT